MKSIINKADWKIILTLTVALIVIVNILSDIGARHLLHSTKNDIKSSIDETKNFIESTSAKAKKSDEEITAQFEKNFERIDDMQAKAEDQISKLGKNFKKMNP